MTDIPATPESSVTAPPAKAGRGRVRTLLGVAGKLLLNLGNTSARLCGVLDDILSVLHALPAAVAAVAATAQVAVGPGVALGAPGTIPLDVMEELEIGYGFDLPHLLERLAYGQWMLSMLCARLELRDFRDRCAKARIALREKMRQIAAGLLPPTKRMLAKEAFRREMNMDPRYMPPGGDWKNWGKPRKQRASGTAAAQRWAEMCKPIEGRTDEDILAEACECFREVARALGEEAVEDRIDRTMLRVMDLVSGDAAWTEEQCRELGIEPMTDWPYWADDPDPLPRRRR